jgi:hypothetical protein
MGRLLVRCCCALALAPALLHGQTPPDSSHRDSVVTRHPPLSWGARITGARLDSLPLDDPASAFAQIPGVFMRGGDVGIDPAFTLSIRGGTFGAPATFVDGAPVRSHFGTPFITPALNGIGAVDVTTGVSSAQLSDAQGGVISYLTATGGDRFAAHWSAHTDAPFGSGTSVGYNRFAGVLGGPVPGLAGLTWFASGTVQGQGSEYLGAGAQDVPTYVVGGIDTTVQVLTGSGTQAVVIPKFTQWSGSCDAGTNGADCRGLSRPMDWSTSLQFQGKVSWAYGRGSRVAVTGLAAGVQERFFPGTDLGDPSLFSGAHEWTRLAVVNWHQTLMETLAFDATMSLGTDRGLEGALDPTSENATRDPSLGIELTSLSFSSFGGLTMPLSDQIVRNIRSNSGLRVPYLGRTDLNDAQPYRMNPYGMASGGFYTQGIAAPLAFELERRLTGRWQLEWHPDERNQVAVGADADGSDLSSYSVASPINQIFLDAWSAKPRRFGLFATDLVTLGPAVVDVGVRYDRLNPGGELSRTPGFVFSDPAWDPAAQSSDSAYAASLARVFQPTRDQTFLSPRIRFAMTLGPQTAIHLGLGQQVEAPPISTILANANSDLTNTNANAGFGRDVTYGKSTLVEGGIQQALPLEIGMDLGLYYRGGIPQYGYDILSFNDPTNPGRQLTLSVLDAGRTGYAVGVEERLTRRFTSFFSSALTYQFTANAVGGTSALAYLEANARAISAITGSALPPGEAAGSSGKLFQHAIALSTELAVPAEWTTGGWSVLRNVAAVLQVRMISGLPYTPLANVGDGTLAPTGSTGFSAVQAGDVNSKQLPWTKFVDLRLTKGVHAGSLDWTIFADIRNLFNFKNIYALYAETNDVNNAIYYHNVIAGEYTTLANEASGNGALNVDGSVNLGNCGSWTGAAGPVDCVSLRRTEARFGNGDGVYTLAEQGRALTNYFNLVYGSSRFYGPQRTLRVGLQLGF